MAEHETNGEQGGGAEDAEDVEAPAGGRLPLDVAEWVVVVLLVAMAVLLLTNLAAGLVTWASNANLPGLPGSYDAGRVLLQIGNTPTVLALPLTLAALGLLWWRVEAWSSTVGDLEEVAEDEDLVEELDEATDEDVDAEADDLVEALGHLDRLRSSTGALLVLTGAFGLAVVAYGVGIALVATYTSGTTEAASDLSNVGLAVAVFLVLVVVLAAVRHVRSLADLALFEEELEDDEDAAAETALTGPDDGESGGTP